MISTAIKSIRITGIWICFIWSIITNPWLSFFGLIWIWCERYGFTRSIICIAIQGHHIFIYWGTVSKRRWLGGLNFIRRSSSKITFELWNFRIGGWENGILSKFIFHPRRLLTTSIAFQCILKRWTSAAEKYIAWMNGTLEGMRVVWVYVFYRIKSCQLIWIIVDRNIMKISKCLCLELSNN